MWEFQTHAELKSYLNVLPGQGWQFNLLIDNKIWGYFWYKKSELIKSLIFITQLSKYIYIYIYIYIDTLSILVKLVNSCLKVSIFKQDISKEYHEKNSQLLQYKIITSSGMPTKFPLDNQHKAQEQKPINKANQPWFLTMKIYINLQWFH